MQDFSILTDEIYMLAKENSVKKPKLTSIRKYIEVK